MQQLLKTLNHILPYLKKKESHHLSRITIDATKSLLAIPNDFSFSPYLLFAIYVKLFTKIILPLFAYAYDHLQPLRHVQPLLFHAQRPFDRKPINVKAKQKDEKEKQKKK